MDKQVVPESKPTVKVRMPKDKTPLFLDGGFQPENK